MHGETDAAAPLGETRCGASCRLLACMACALLVAFDTRADDLAHYLPDANDVVNGEIHDSFLIPADRTDPHVIAGDLGQSVPNGFFNVSVWPVSADHGFDANDYLSFTLQATPGYALDLGSLHYTGFSYLTSTLSLHLRSSLDGFANDIASATTTGSGFRVFDFSYPLGGLPGTVTTPVEFRLYPDNNGQGNDFLDLWGDPIAGLRVEGSSTPWQRALGDRMFYSFNLGIIGGDEIAAGDRHLRLLALDAQAVLTQNQASGNARVECASGTEDFDAVAAYAGAAVTQQFPACLAQSTADLPSEVMIWKLPNGDLFKFQLLEAQTMETIPQSGVFAAEAIFVAAPIAEAGQPWQTPQWYSFSLDQTGGEELPLGDRQLRFVASSPTQLALQADAAGNTRVACSGTRDFLSIRSAKASTITQTQTSCQLVTAGDMPSEVSLWRVPSGRLYKFQLVSLAISEPMPGQFSAEGVFQAAAIIAEDLFANGFEDP